MDFGYYIIVVALLAAVYAAVIRVVQNRLINRGAMQELQKQSQAFNDEYKKASQRKDQPAMDRIMKQQMDLFPRMNALMMEQFKAMAVILLVFFAFNWTAGHFDPTVQDDIGIEARDNGQGCDRAAADGVFGACVPAGAAHGVEVAHATAFAGGSTRAQNATAFLWGNNAGGGNGNRTQEGAETPSNVYVPHPSANLFSAVLPFLFPPPGTLSIEEADGALRVTPPSGTDRVEIRLDNSTRFFVDLPFTIPLINVQRIYEPYWWFIFVALIAGLAYSTGSGAWAKIRGTGSK